MQSSPILGIIGGTGVYKFDQLSNIREEKLTTPFGDPSSPIIIGDLKGKTVAFLIRHGKGHTIPPTDVNYRANIYAFKSLGVKKIIGISACGSLREDFAPGDFVIPDQIIDFTKDRKRTFFENGLVAHISPAEPFCSELSEAIYQAILPTETNIHKGSTIITIEGPRFSTRAESHLFRSWGISTIGMTTSPEAFLAREAEIAYACLAHVTDYDVWHQHGEPVTVEMIVKTLNRNSNLALQVISNLVENFPEEECSCNSALQSALTSNPDAINPDSKQKLSLLINKYLK
jgi:5'-methylthioadenosine phosphorylase